MHDGSFGSGRFCCKSCSHSRTFTQSTRNKLKASHKKNWESGIYDKVDRVAINSNPEKIKKVKETWNKKIENGEIKSAAGLRNYILRTDGHKCQMCGIEDWQGSYLPMELDHIDGDNKNNTLENVRLLCPNCHAQTPTWRKAKKYLH